MNIIEKILEFFRKKEYHALEYEDLNTIPIDFNQLNENELQKIKKVLLELNESKIINDKKAKLYMKDALEFDSIDVLLENIKESILRDYRETYFEAINNNWDFIYFLTDYKPIYEDLIYVCNKINSSKSSNTGSVMYPLLAIKKFNGFYYFWEFD